MKVRGLCAVARALRLRTVAEIEDVTTPADTWRQFRATGRRCWEVWGVRVTPWREAR